MRPVPRKAGIRCPLPLFVEWPLVGSHSLLFGSLRGAVQLQRQTSLVHLPPPQQTAELRNTSCWDAGVLCIDERDAARKKAPVKGLEQMKQDKITIHGPKNDGTYLVEFKTADGVALAFSVPKGGGTAVLEYFQDKMPYGLAVPDVPRTISRAFYWPKSF